MMQSSDVPASGNTGLEPTRCHWLISNARWLLPVLLVLIGAAAYAPAAWGVFVLDDRSYLHQGGSLTSFWPLDRFLARRGTTDFTFAINYAIDGLNPRGYHIFNVIIHLLASLTLFATLRRLLSLPRWSAALQTAAPWLSFVIAAIWLVHPLQTQAVTYVIQRSESMAGLFVLLSAYGLTRHVLDAQKRWALVCLLGTLLAIWTKESAITAPAALLLLDGTLLAGSFKTAMKKRWWLYVILASFMLLPFLSGINELRGKSAASDVAPVVNLGAQPQNSDSQTSTRQPAATAAAVAEDRPAPVHKLPSIMTLGQYPSAGFSLPGMTSRQYFFTQPAVITFYLAKTFWPGMLSLQHNWRPMTTPWGQWRSLDLQLSLALLVTLAVLSLGSLWKMPGLGFAGCWFFLSLAVSSSFIPINDLAVEHRMYLALISVIAVAVLAVWKGVHFWGSIPSHKQLWIYGMLALCVILALGVRTFVRNTDYQSELALWEDAATHHDPSPRALLNLGSAYYENKQVDKAEEQYLKVLHQSPGHANALMNLGSIYFNRRDLEPAERYYSQALRMSPNSATTLVYLSRIATLRQQDDKALNLLLQAHDCEPDSSAILMSIARVQYTLKQYDQSLETYEKALLLTGPDAAILTNMGMVRLEQGKLQEATDLFTRATQADPGFVYSWEQLARNQARQGRYKKALASLQKAISIQPGMLLSQQLAMLLAHSPDPQVRNIPQAMSIVSQGLQMTGRQDLTWLEVAAKVALAAGRPDLALQAETEALNIAQKRGAPASVLEQAQAEVNRLQTLVNEMTHAGTAALE